MLWAAASAPPTKNESPEACSTGREGPDAGFQWPHAVAKERTEQTERHFFVKGRNRAQLDDCWCQFDRWRSNTRHRCRNLLHWAKAWTGEDRRYVGAVTADPGYQTHLDAYAPHGSGCYLEGNAQGGEDGTEGLRRRQRSLTMYFFAGRAKNLGIHKIVLFATTACELTAVQARKEVSSIKMPRELATCYEFQALRKEP